MTLSSRLAVDLTKCVSRLALEKIIHTRRSVYFTQAALLKAGKVFVRQSSTAI